MEKTIYCPKKLTKRELKALNYGFTHQDPIILAQLPKNALEAMIEMERHMDDDELTPKEGVDKPIRQLGKFLRVEI